MTQSLNATTPENQENGLKNAEAAQKRLDEANKELFGVIQTYLAASKEGDVSDDEKEARRLLTQRIWATSYRSPENNPDGSRIPQGGIEHDGTRVVYGNHENMEGSLYVYDGEDALRYRWGGTGGQHIYLNGDENFAFGSNIARLGGDDVVGMDENGVRMVTRESQKKHMNDYASYSVAMAERRGAKKKIFRALGSLLGTKDVEPNPPAEPAPVTVGHTQLSDTMNAMAEKMEKATAVLMKEIHRIEQGITEQKKPYEIGDDE